MKIDIRTTKKLNNGVEIPLLGLGVFQTEDGRQTADAVHWAIDAGYRHIDTAAAYGNEEGVGQGIRESGVDRRELFITTKLWNEDMRRGTQLKAFEKSLKLMKLEYVDLYLIHWPVAGKYLESWQVLEEIYVSGRARAIGVSNFHEHHLADILGIAKVLPAVNQIECHPRLTQEPLVKYCEMLNIGCEAWSPLGGTGGNLMEDPTLRLLAEKYEKSVAQVILRWDLQRGLITIPKSTHQDRIIANANLYDFELSMEDMAVISGLNQNRRVGPNPETFDF